MTMEQLNTKVDHALQAVEVFCTLLETETAALKASKFDVFETLQNDKTILAQHYQKSILDMEEDADLLKELDQERKTSLHAAHTRFTKVSEENQSMLEIAINVTGRIVDTIMEAARRSVSDGPAYSAAGIQGLSDKIPVHFKLNEVL